MITADELRRELRYDRDTGEFWWLVPRRRRQRDRQAGSIVTVGRSQQTVRTICIDNRRYYAHRLAFLWVTGRWPEEIDHIDGNPLNNKWSNLREANRSENNCNRAVDPTRLRGASFHKPSGKWQACIKKDGKQKTLGYFNTEQEAHEAYVVEAKKLHGEFCHSSIQNLVISETPRVRLRDQRRLRRSVRRGGAISLPPLRRPVRHKNYRPFTITAEELRRELRYDRETGDFWWLVPATGRQMDRPAGSIRWGDGSRLQTIRRICFHNKRYPAHRLAFLYMIGKCPIEVDHIDGDTLNNKWSNLRAATRSENLYNRPGAASFRGACFHKRIGRWQSYINKDGKRIHLGYFRTRKEAHEAYLAAARSLHGKFHRSS